MTCKEPDHVPVAFDNWARRPLDEAQRRYASADAEILLALRAALDGTHTSQV